MKVDKIKCKTLSQLEETKKHMKPYMDDEEETKELREMCKYCGDYCGKEHDYTECEDKECFNFWLAFQYLEWKNSYS